MQARSTRQPTLPADRLAFRTIFGLATRLDVIGSRQNTLIITASNIKIDIENRGEGLQLMSLKVRWGSNISVTIDL